MRDFFACLSVCREFVNRDYPNFKSRRGGGCFCKLSFKDSTHAYRTTYHALISCSFVILRYEKIFLFFAKGLNMSKCKINRKDQCFFLHLLAFSEISIL